MFWYHQLFSCCRLIPKFCWVYWGTSAKTWLIMRSQILQFQFKFWPALKTVLNASLQVLNEQNNSFKTFFLWLLGYSAIFAPDTKDIILRMKGIKNIRWWNLLKPITGTFITRKAGTFKQLCFMNTKTLFIKNETPKYGLSFFFI